jgi:F-type H+-transporting ATPase subunit alpha
MVATLNQPQYEPWPLEEQVAALYAGAHGWLDSVPVRQVPRFHDEFREHLRTEGTVYESIRAASDLTDDAETTLKTELERFMHGFNVEEEKGLAG